MKFKFALIMLAPFLLSIGCTPAVKVASFPQVGSGSINQPSTTGALYIKPQVPMVNSGNMIPVFAGGGAPPYTYNVMTLNGGYFSENIFSSTTVTGQIQASVTDSKGKVLYFVINVIPTN